MPPRDSPRVAPAKKDPAVAAGRRIANGIESLGWSPFGDRGFWVISKSSTSVGGLTEVSMLKTMVWHQDGFFELSRPLVIDTCSIFSRRTVSVDRTMLDLVIN